MTARRWYLSRIVGTGVDEPGDRDPFRPKLADLAGPVTWSGVDGREDVQSPDGWMLVIAETDDAQHAALEAAPDVRALDGRPTEQDVAARARDLGFKSPPPDKRAEIARHLSANGAG